jgi:hypothetical protein
VDNRKREGLQYSIVALLFFVSSVHESCVR